MPTKSDAPNNANQHASPSVASSFGQFPSEAPEISAAPSSDLNVHAAAQQIGSHQRSISPQVVLGLQRTIGNHSVIQLMQHKNQAAVSHTAVAQSIAGYPTQIGTTPSIGNDLGGFSQNVDLDQEDQDLGGNTFGETIGDIARPVGTALGNVVGGVTGALTGISISSTTQTAPTWNNHGQFNWVVGFTTTGTNGWLVQKIENTRRAEDAAGKALPDGLTPKYWEAWAVDATSTITPSHPGPAHDYWTRRSWGPNTQGHWSSTGSVYFTTTDPATQGFAAGGAPEAGSLLSSTTEPSGLGIARLHRFAQGTWDSTGATPTHTGSAK